MVDVLIDASGSQMSRQGEVALQAYIISESLSNAGLPHRVMSYCTFWDYTILHRFREYDDPRSANENIFNYVTSSNNRDGLAIRAAGYGLLMREEEKKILIILSDGRPYDVVVNRPNARNPQPYHGKYAITDTADPEAAKPGRKRSGCFCRGGEGSCNGEEDFWKGFCIHPQYYRLFQDRRTLSDQTAGG